jgi:predicted outer membrane repeat protein
MTAGSYEMGAFVDRFDEISESDESNNYYSSFLNVVTGSLPDLMITAVEPQSVVPGYATTVAVTIRNVGSATAPATSTRYEVDGGLHSISMPTPSLAPGQDFVATGSLPGLSDGDHPTVVTADYDGVVTENDESNNVYSFTLTAEGPNLIVESFSPAEFTDAEPMIIDVVVRNIGNAPAGQSYTRVDFGPAGPVTTSLTSAIPAGSSTTVPVHVSILPDPGEHSVEVCADFNHMVIETSEIDNCLPGTVTLSPTTIIWPDGLAQYPTLQDAIDAVAPGGLIRVLGGTYTGDGNRDLDFGGKDLSLVRFSEAEVIIDCQGGPEEPHRGFGFNSGESRAALVSGLTIINGWQDSGNGGGIRIGSAEPTIRDCVIRDCHAFEGGAISFSSVHSYFHPLIQGCTLVGNSANFGNAIFAAGNIGPELVNTLIADNSGFYGAIVCGGATGTPHFALYCCNIWGNSNGDWVNCIAGMDGSDGNVSINPLFCHPGADDYHIAENSPCAPAMNPSCGLIGALPPACGFMGGIIREVRADGSGPYLTIQHALNNCLDGDIVELADGIYSGPGNRDLNTLGRAVVVRSASGDPSACLIEGQGGYRGFYLHSAEGPETVITGIGIVNGFADKGGGIACDGASPTLDNLHVYGCQATDDGGGIHLINSASPNIQNCVFEDNTATDDGGGLYAHDWSSPVITGTLFLENTTGDRGGGAAFSVNCFPEIDDCTFEGNVGVQGGGLTFVYAYGPVTNSIFRGNEATNGGGFQGYGNAQCDFQSCTFTDNTAPNGANIYLRNNSDPTFDQCIVAFGISGTGFDRYADDCTPTLTCTDVHGNALGDWTAMITDQLGINGNFNADPLFCDRLGGDLTLRGDSPCALANNVDCGQVGALPVGCTGTWLVKPDGTGDFPTIQEAIDAAVAGETIKLAAGTFTGPGNRDLNFLGKAITLQGYGESFNSVIDCQGSSSNPHFGIDFNSGETSSSWVKKITIKNGWRNTGGAVRVEGCSPRLSGIIFLDNEAGDSGGAVIITGGATPLLEHCRFEGNTSPNAGGAIYINTSFPLIEHGLFIENSAVWGGGAIYNQHAGPNVLYSHFFDNTSAHWGGAVHSRYVDSAPHFTDCLFSGNSAPQGGAVYSRDSATPSFTTCTFFGNSSDDGAAIRARTNSFTIIIRCILAFSPLGAAASADETGTVTLFCSDVFGNNGGDYTGPLAGQNSVNDNIEADPVFCDPYNGDLRLSSTSPCLYTNSPCGFNIGWFGEGCTVTGVEDPLPGLPGELTLLPNTPNPFNPMTVIKYNLPEAGLVRVTVHDMSGRKIRDLVNSQQVAGPHEVAWRARDTEGRSLASGLYFVLLSWKGETRVQKIMLIR